MNRLLLIPIISLAPMPVLAHHSMTEFDFSVVEELEGNIVDVSWRNPHIGLTLRTEDSEGRAILWELEAQDINSLKRRGLSSSPISVGDFVRVAGYLSTARVNRMSVSNVLLPNGTEISIRGNPAPRWSTEERIGFDQTTAEEALAAAGEGQGLFRVWMRAQPGGFPAELPLTAAARATRDEWNPAEDPTMQCIASGMPAAMRLSPPHPIDLAEQGDNIIFRAELFDIVRTIHMRYEAGAAVQPATALGHSVGHWDDSTLVVRTTRVNWPYFDHLGSIPQSDTVEMTERFTVSDDGNQLIYELDINDPATFTRPVSGRWVLAWRPDLAVERYDCVAEG